MVLATMDAMAFIARLGAALRAWIAGAPGWLGGLLAGVQAALLSLALVLIPTWVIVAAAPAAPSAPTPEWGEATTVAVRLWLLAFGVSWDLDGVEITLAPLGLTAITALMLVALARRFADKSWTSGLCAVGAFAAGVGTVAALTWAGTEHANARVVQAVAMAVLMAVPCVAWGIWRAHGATLAWLRRLPLSVRTGTRLAVVAGGGHVVLAAVVGAIWVVAGRHAVGDMATALGPDVAGGVALAALEALWVPTVVVWYLSWWTGLGFVVGTVHLAPGHVVEGALPQIPLLGALPHAVGGALAWAPLVVVAVAAAARWAVGARLPQGWHRWVSLGVATALVAGGAALAAGAASGAMGPGTLAQVGVEAGPFAVITAALMAAGFVAAELLTWAWGWLMGAGAVKDGAVTNGTVTNGAVTNGAVKTDAVKTDAGTVSEEA